MEKNILLIDKETGWTSFDVVAKIRNQLTDIGRGATFLLKQARVKVGHAGTLDPFATGLLIVLVGKEMTKRQDEFMKLDKEYEATLELGKVSTTGDPEGTITPFCHSELDPESRKPIKRGGQLDPSLRGNDIRKGGNDRFELEIPSGKYQIPKKIQILNVLKKFTGEIEQIPPAHSAIKVNGKKAYELARKGIDPMLKSRKVTIHSIEIIDYKWPFLKLKINCGSGTYIRSLAQDIGEDLGVGAYLTELRRTRIEEFNVKDALKIGELSF